MIHTVLLLVSSLAPAPALFPPPLALAAPVTTPVLQDNAAEYQTRLGAAGSDVAKLLALADWCKEQGMQMEMAGTLEKVLEFDADNEVAHKGLRHHSYDGQWFKTYVELSKYKRAEEKRMLEEEGMVRFKDGWAKKEHVPYLRMGWLEDGQGGYISPRKKAEAERMQKYAAEGWSRQTDLTWVAPDEASNWDKQLVKCGDQWLDAEAADKYHSEIGQWWQYPGERFIVYSTLGYNSTYSAVWYADQAYPNLARAYGVQPEEAPIVVVLDGLAQYNSYAAGDQNGGRPPAESDGSSSFHHAFFANTSFEMAEGVPEYAGRGVAYWDRTDAKLDAWGPYAIRHAAALSYAEAIDPSWDAVSRGIEGGGQNFQLATFWQEKRIPMWFRFGTASYVETYFKDETSAHPWLTRDFAFDQLLEKGGLRPIEQVLAFALDSNNATDGTKLIAEAGLLVSFIMDGNCGPVIEAHRAFKAALAKPDVDTGPAVEQLQSALISNQEALKKFFAGRS